MILMQLPDFEKVLGTAVAAMHEAINREYKRQLRIMFVDLVTRTPQWSGNYASNWRITTNPNSSAYTPSPWKGATRRENAGVRGDTRGTATPIRLTNISLAKVDFRQPVYFMNNTPTIFEEDTGSPGVVGYEQPFEGANMASMTKVRPENLIDGQVALASYIVNKYK